MHCLEGPEVERQVLDTVRAAVVKVHARGYLGPRAACQGPGPDRTPGAASPRHPGSTPDRSPGPRDSQPPPWATRRDYISRRALEMTTAQHIRLASHFGPSVFPDKFKAHRGSSGGRSTWYPRLWGNSPPTAGTLTPTRPTALSRRLPCHTPPESGRYSRHALSARGSAVIVRRSRGPWWTVPSL